MWLKIIVSIYFCASSACVESTQADKQLSLEFVQVLFRHGERTPLEGEFNTYNYTDASVYEPYGFGQLTNTGKREAYDLGRKLREKYKSLLSAEHEWNESSSYTSDNARTKMSLHLLLAGLYEPMANNSWSPDLKWIPVPYHVIPLVRDVLLKSNDNRKFQKIWKESEKISEHQALVARHKVFLDFVQEKTGVEINRVHGLEFVRIYNVLLLNKRMNITMPDWFRSDMMEDFFKVVPSILDTLSVTQQMKRLNGGTIIRQFLINANVEAARAKPRKMYLYSGHDLNIGALLRTLGLKHRIVPDFASCFNFEKYRSADNETYVRDKDTVLKLDSCAEFCEIGEFTKIVNNVLPSEEELKYFVGLDDMDKINRLYGAVAN